MKSKSKKQFQHGVRIGFFSTTIAFSPAVITGYLILSLPFKVTDFSLCCLIKPSSIGGRLFPGIEINTSDPGQIRTQRSALGFYTSMSQGPRFQMKWQLLQFLFLVYWLLSQRRNNTLAVTSCLGIILRYLFKWTESSNILKWVRFSQVKEHQVSNGYNPWRSLK